MATKNLFEQYGIKEVADVTFYRIEKKEETYESQREFNVASVLKGAVELRTVYPMVDGVGSDEGFEAYVFVDADVITGTNYDCDDSISATIIVKGKFNVDDQSEAYEPVTTYKEVTPAAGDDPSEKGWYTYNGTTYVQATDHTVVEGTTYYEQVITPAFKETFTAAYRLDQLQDEAAIAFSSGYPVYTNEATQMPISSVVVAEDYTVGTTDSVTITFTRSTQNLRTKKAVYNFKVSYTGVSLTNSEDTSTGVYNTANATTPDALLGIGTHEFSYPQQAFMLFAKRQNLIAKTGTRYQFGDADSLMGGLEFYDDYAGSPNSTEKVVILGLAGSTGYTDTTYDIEEINAALKNLTQSYKAKAYDVSYGTYAELVVEDEMGYYNPKFLGNAYDKANGVIEPFVSGADATVTEAQQEYREWATDNRGCDIAIANATMWGNNTHYSINDAIDALKQKKYLLDAAETSGLAGIEGIFGGYQVTSDADPAVTTEDIDDTYSDSYSYKAGNTTLDTVSKYSLQSVIEALTEIGYNSSAIGQYIRVNYAENASNRAIYVRVSGAIDTAAGAYIYLLHNKNYRRLTTDEAGIFSFEDKKGNTLYYQDKIFKKVEWLALVIIGNKGLIYVVNRHGSKTENRTAWLVNETGYLTDANAQVLVKNGLIHTTDFTVGNETFEATAEVMGLKVKKITKTVTQYKPVLFLDTLKVSTIEQSAEEVYATGGRGNGQLIGWDYGKAITLTLQDALYTPASMSATYGSYEGNDFRKGVQEVTSLDRMEPVTAKRNFIVPAGNVNGTPTEADKNAYTVYYDPRTMEPYPDGTPIAEGEYYLKYTRSVAYDGNSLGHKIEISADKFPGTYKIVGDTYARARGDKEDQRFQFVIPEAKMGSNQTITLEAEGDPAVFDMNITVLRPKDGVMMQFIQYDVVENTEENDGSTMVKGTENLNLLDDAELFKVSTAGSENDAFIGATEY